MVRVSCADSVVCQAAKPSARIVPIRKMLVISISFRVSGGEQRDPERSGLFSVTCLPMVFLDEAENAQTNSEIWGR